MNEELRFTQEIKDLWLKALRSGYYKQGWERYHTEDRFCCIAVLGEVTKHFTEGENEYPSFSETAINHGILIQLNDQEGFDFNQIADYIEEHATVEEG